MSSGTREDFTGPPDPEPCSCDEALGLREKLDAALGACRALEEEVEKDAEEWREEAWRIGQDFAATESRLAEATALLDEWTTCPAAGYTPGRLLKRVHAFLSSTTAQASEPYKREPRTIDGRTLFQVDNNLNPDGTVRVHPDTIALRECRAELRIHAKDANRYAQELSAAHLDNLAALKDVESARAERAAEFAAKVLAHEVLETVRAERDTALQRAEIAEGQLREDTVHRHNALAHIAELEAALESKTQESFSWEGQNRTTEDYTKTLEDRIARAVAELEQCAEPRIGAVDRALEALR
jgi:hypothetical protein